MEVTEGESFKNDYLYYAEDAATEKRRYTCFSHGSLSLYMLCICVCVWHTHM